MRWMILALLGATAACNTTEAKPPRAAASGLGAPHADFASYQTFTFGPANPPPAGYETTARSLEVQRRLTPIVQASLEKRGYVAGDDTADLIVKISTGSGSMPGEAPQIGGSTPPGSSGFIGIDVYDRATGAAVWHGSGLAEVDPQRVDDQLLTTGVERIFQSLPARRIAQPSAKADL